MSKTLTAAISQQITNKRISTAYIFKINDVEYSNYVLSWSVDNSKDFGSASATFDLNNNLGNFNEGETNEINIGDIVEFIEKYGSDSTEFQKFYGIVNQRTVNKTSSNRTITLVCLDYISILQTLDVNLLVEGTKIKVEDETLTPNYLDAPNDMFSSIFDFANDAICDNPLPILTVVDKANLDEDPQYDGFEVIYDTGQVKLGAPLNARDNYDLVAKTYYCYTRGVYIEDIIEQLITQVDGYGKYLFGETSAANVITNHLTDTFLRVENKAYDVMTPNYTSSDITLYFELAQDYDPDLSGIDPTVLYLTDTTGLPDSGTATLNGDSFSWTGKGSGNTLTGISESGSYALKAHKAGLYVKYTATYAPGQVWYLTYSNVQTDLVSSDFTLPSGATFRYFDKRFGRIILESAISTSLYVDCTNNYTFKTLQATGIELNKISFRPRELDNRFEALNKLREYIAPNYVIRTQGDDRIWASFLYQKTNEDYTLSLVKSLDYMEDEDLYTRVVYYGKNKNPNNIMYNEGIDFLTTGEDYKAIATDTTLEYYKTEDGYYWYRTLITDAGYISAQTIKPKIWINNVLVDNKSHYLNMMPVKWQVTTKTTTTTTTQSSGKCFIAGTTVRMSDGSKKNIEDVHVGDIVKTYNYKTGKIENKKVNSVTTLNNIEKLIKINNTVCTYDHPFFVKGKGWSSYNPELTLANYGLEVRLIDIDDSIFYYDDDKLITVKVKTINEIGGQKVYTLSDVEDNHNFFADDYLVHNGGGGGTSTTETTFTLYTYRIYFAHQNIESSQPIVVWNALGDQSQSIVANDPNMDYGRGIYYVPGSSQNTVVEAASSASYWVFYGDDSVSIDYDNVIFKIRTTLITEPETTAVKATFMYWTSLTSVHDIKNVIDGRWNTQVQSEFYAQPPTGYNYAILDLGAIYKIQALDIVAGFFKPDENRRFDLDFRVSLEYSLDNVDYYAISDETHNVEFTGGSSKSFEEEDLGTDFQARYLKLILENVKKIDYKTEQGIYVVAFTEIAAYDNIVLRSEALLVPTTKLTAPVSFGDTVVNVESTDYFDDPDSAGGVVTAYIDGVAFTYTGRTATTFTGCVISSGTIGEIGDRVHHRIKNDDTELYDDDALLPKLGDRMYKNVNVTDEVLYSQTQLDYQAISLLKEFYKNHSKVTVEVMYAPYLQVGQTVRLIDSFTGINRNYFIDKISDSTGNYSLTLAYYPL